MTTEQKTFAIASCLFCMFGMDIGGLFGFRFYVFGQLAAFMLLYKGN